MSEHPDYLDPYREAVRDGGPRFESLLWRSPEAQRLRFDVMIACCKLRGRVIVDLGSGLGDFALRMHERGVEYGRYIGIEGVDQLAGESRKRLKSLPECEVRSDDFVADATLFRRLVKDDRAEVLAFSGSLNTLTQEEAERVLGRAWDAIANVKGGQLVFNFLSDRSRKHHEPTGPAHRFDALRLTGWALDRATRVKLRHDYWHGHDATVWMGV
ncbi:MAG: hypothetical protein H6810_07750 [Phycisphaeraceae bacterium]|nr:MAG: hypothetical protein H6810_07750 [Phycisphaeraceae bacterium]